MFREFILENDLNTQLFVLQSHMESMLERIKQNSTTLHRFQAFEMRLLQLNSLADMIEHILEDAKHYFDLDVISLCLVDENGEISKILHENGYECTAKPDLILLDNKKLISTLGFAFRPYIGLYKTPKCAEFFPGPGKKPASVAITPLIRRGNYLGALSLGSYQSERFVETMGTDFVEHLVSIVSVCLENNLNFETIRRTSFIDGLTGVNNRRFLEQRITEELDRCQRNFDPISCLFLDIDFFKSINDQQGHLAGDKVLCAVANAIKTQLRSNDVLARYGGEEFVVLLSDIDEAMALDIAERIRQTIQALAIKLDDNAIFVTVSIGSATYLPTRSAVKNDTDLPSKLIKLADSALYEAKRNGRNRVENGGVIAEKAVLEAVNARPC